MPHPTAYKTRDSPTIASQCDATRHKSGIGIMTDVMDARPRQHAVAAPPQLGTQAAKRVSKGPVRDRTSTITDEEGVGMPRLRIAITFAGIPAHRLCRSRMQRYQPRLTELGLFDPQNSTGQVDVVSVEAQSLGDP